jgi:D-alanyl-D-alanine carboxypeptidase/D-alanyl-D-alanine-endopeptidase (penicillin-binding protein 4)
MNKTTAAQVVRLLRYMANSTYAEDYINTLAVAGCNGTLANFCKSTSLDGSIMGKSGSMSGVRGYAGYVKIENANDLAFCIIVNNHVEPTKELVNKIERWLVKLVKK